MEKIEVKLTYSNKHLAGTYKPTIIDERKEFNNRLVSITGNIYTVITIDNETLFIKGKRAWKKWSNNNDYVTDF